MKFFVIEDFKAGFDNQWFIKRALVLGDFFKRFVNPHGGSIRTMRCHGLHHVSDADYTSRQENIIPDKTPGLFFLGGEG